MALTRQTRVAVDARWDLLLVIAAGGAVGSLARYAGLVALPHRPEQFPWATFVENVTGAFLLGLLVVYLVDVLPPSRYARPFLGVGVLGGYTTFSTYMFDTTRLLQEGRPATAGLYLGGTLLVGLTAVWAGLVAGRGSVLLLRRRAASRRASRHPVRQYPADDSRSAS